MQQSRVLWGADVSREEEREWSERGECSALTVWHPDYHLSNLAVGGIRLMHPNNHTAGVYSSFTSNFALPALQASRLP